MPVSIICHYGKELQQCVKGTIACIGPEKRRAATCGLIALFLASSELISKCSSVFVIDIVPRMTVPGIISLQGVDNATTPVKEQSSSEVNNATPVKDQSSSEVNAS